MNRLGFQELAEARLLDAKALFEAGRFDADRADAEKLAEDILLAISDAEHGVLKCLSKYW